MSATPTRHTQGRNPGYGLGGECLGREGDRGERNGLAGFVGRAFEEEGVGAGRQRGLRRVDEQQQARFGGGRFDDAGNALKRDV